ncbi:cation:proton antiporter [Streptomyces sp. SID10853]|uniref:cation:proton antiporter n=1 Tax=Streptomyces sp. SID10853 TaxID=2706028 RepID=UPI0013C16BF3|nr:cation:proton antiporter [Streptomyces sp. SID10853]NDZ78903.1 cation:proton antiporter [Streptomyces sp. SID10853]
MSQADLFHVLLGIALLLAAAHGLGRLFVRLRQPAVVGEILGGLLLGPTVLGQAAPGLADWLFPSTGAGAVGRDLVYQLGLLLLMFTAGAHMRKVFSRQDSRVVVLTATIGMVVPFAVGLAGMSLVKSDGLMGPAGNTAALTIVVSCSIAVTSIPVISRILLDLGIMRSALARVVLSVAVLEDIVLNVLLSIALGMVAGSSHSVFGLARTVHAVSGTGAAVYYAAASIGFFLLALLAAVLLRKIPNGRAWRRPWDSVAMRTTVVLGTSALCLVLGVAPMFGAFVVGLLTGTTGRAGTAATGPTRTVQDFAAGFFIPVYFAVVGLKLDLIHSFSIGFTLVFLAVACVSKASSVYAGARFAGRRGAESLDLAVALNARGGPGIVMATTAYDVGIVSASLFTTLIVTAVLTSQLAGWWLERAVRDGRVTPAPDTRVDERAAARSPSPAGSS